VATIKSKQGNLGKEIRIKGQKILSHSKSVYLKINDYRVFDGDMVSIKVNEEEVIKRKVLTKRSKFIKIPLRTGINKIVIQAKNEGLKRPNTVDILIVDGIQFNIGKLRLKKGQKKSIEVIVPI